MTNNSIRQTSHQLDASAIREELEMNSELWSADTSRQRRITCQRDTETIFVRSPKKPLPQPLASKDARVTVWTKYASQVPKFRSWVENFGEQIHGSLGRVFLIRIRGGGSVYPHRDVGSYYESRERFHAVISSSGGIETNCGSHSAIMREGEVWWLDNTDSYELHNPSSDPAVYAIVDVLPFPSPRSESAEFKHFELLDPEVDISTMLSELRDAEQIWDQDTSRQTKIRVQRETSNIPLRGAKKPPPPGVTVRDIHPSVDTGLANFLPSIHKWVSDFTQRVGGELSRLSVVRLNPNGTVHPHVDEGEYYLARDRYHLVLISPLGSEMHCGDEVVTFQEGQLWWFDNKAMHHAFNLSDVGRVHVIFDIKPDRFPDGPDGSEAMNSRGENALSRTALDGGSSNDLYQPFLEQCGTWLNDGCPRDANLDWPKHLTNITLRSRGKIAGDAWHSPIQDDAHRWPVGNPWPSQADRGQEAIDSIEVFIAERKEPISFRSSADLDGVLGNQLRGIVGLELEFQSNRVAISPNQMIATNRTFSKSFDRLNQSHADAWPDRTELRSVNLLHGVQFLVRAEDSSSGPAIICPLVRGRRLVDLAETDASQVRSLVELLSEYLLGCINDDGSAAYLYYPSRGKYDASRNNQIRQWMATLALARIWKRDPRQEVQTRLQANLEFNLRAYYSCENGFGIINDRGKVKLGAVALAALAIMEGPFAEQYDEVTKSLVATTQQLWNDDGRFRTFYRPAERNDCQNFYPGEALLLWSKLHRRTGDPEILERFSKSFDHYQDWHAAHRNPAFVPWHTQAYYELWMSLVCHGEQRPIASTVELMNRLRDAIFAMNDWLIQIQQWDDAPAEDCRGRFYSPSEPYGPPHASSTGVYLEGLVDAFSLATVVGDDRRANAYRTSLLRGFRSIAQLTFKDQIDMTYVRKQDLVRGGVATTVYDNAIRIDNVQHALMALMKADELRSLLMG